MKRVRAFKKGKGKARTSIEMDGTLYLECYHLGGQMPNNLNNFTLKSVHSKKPVARISFLSKLWYFQYKSKQKVPQF